MDDRGGGCAFADDSTSIWRGRPNIDGAISVCRKLWIPWHRNCRAPPQIYYWIQTFLTFSNLQRSIGKINRKINQTGKFEAVQTFHNADILLAMTGSLTSALRSKILRLLLLHWILLVIVEEIHCHRNIVYTMQENLFMYDSFFKSQFRSKSALRKIFSVTEDFLITYLKQQSWIMQKEMMWFLWEKWDIHVHRFTIFRILKKRHWSNKKKQHVSIR